MQPTYVLLYVENPTASASFYQDLLGREPVERSPNFALFVMDSGLKVGLWARHDVAPKPGAPAGGNELCFSVKGAPEVEAVHARWKAKGLPIAQAPVEMDFGHTFVALDPDGHRLRVFALSM